MYLLLEQQFHLFSTRITNIGQVLSIQLSQLPTSVQDLLSSPLYTWQIES